MWQVYVPNDPMMNETFYHLRTAVDYADYYGEYSSLFTYTPTGEDLTYRQAIEVLKRNSFPMLMERFPLHVPIEEAELLLDQEALFPE